MEIITDLCKYLFFKDSSFKELEVKKTFPTIFNSLVQNKIIQKANPIMSVECLDCDSGHSTDVVLVSGRFMTRCEYGFPAREVNKDEIAGCSFNSLNFSKWLAKELSLAEQVESLTDKIIFLGKKGSKSIFLLLETNHDEAQKLASSINGQDINLIWLGDNPKVGYYQYKLIPLASVVEISSNELSIAKDLNIVKDYKSSYVTGKDDMAFDANVAVTSDYKLLMEFGLGSYKYSVNIFPQAYRVLRYFYDMRNINSGYTTQEIADSLSISSSKTVSTRIKEINDVCTEYKVKPLIIEIVNHKRILNPELDCITQVTSQKR